MEMKENHILAPYNTYLVGGPADFFVEAHSESELIEALKWAEENEQRVFVFGGGSNLLFADEGFRGLVVRVMMDDVRIEDESIYAEAGAKMARVVQAAADAGLTGIEAWSGLPGSVGGAVYGNAGCFGVETKDVLIKAHLYLPSEGVKEVDNQFFEYSYRNSRLKSDPSLKGTTVLSAEFQLKKGDPETIKTANREIAVKRMGKQPPGSSTGSFFKNPSPEQPAGMLIDQCGLKGKMIGKAKVSEHHANFILNTGGATAKDILQLTKEVADEVDKQFGIRLEPEIIFVPAD